MPQTYVFLERDFMRWCICSGMATPSGISTVPTGMETPDQIELRKKKIEDAMEGLVPVDAGSEACSCG